MKVNRRTVLAGMGAAALAHGPLRAFALTSAQVGGYEFVSVSDGNLLLPRSFFFEGLPQEELAQVLVTLGLAFIIADACLLIWTGDPIPLSAPESLRGVERFFGIVFPRYRLAVVVIALIVAVGLWFLLERTRLGAMIRAGVDDPEMARVTGIPVSRLFTIVFALGAALAGVGGVLSGPILSVYPGLDAEMLPLALIIVILGGAGSLPGALLGSFVIGFIYNFGQAFFPDLAYVVLFLPMLLMLVLRPQGLFGKHPS